MRISFLSAFYPYRGGIAQFNANLLAALAKNHEINPYTFSLQYPSFLFPGSSQTVSTYDAAKKVYAPRILNTVNPLSWWTAARMIRKTNPDVLLLRFWIPFLSPALGTFARLVRRRKSTVIISILDNVIPHEKRILDKQLIRYFLDSCQGYMVMSESVGKDLLSFKPAASWAYHPHPVYDHFSERISTANARENLKIPPEKKVLLFFGFIRAYKGLDILLEAMSFLNDDYHLIVAGEPYENFEKYEQMILKLNLLESVSCYVRYIPDSEVPLFFSAADLCVLPYHSATQSGIVPVAYHFDTPVVVTDVGGLRETVIDGETGYVIPSDSRQLAEAIRKYFSGDKKESFIRKIREEKKKYTWNAFAASLENLWKSTYEKASH